MSQSNPHARVFGLDLMRALAIALVVLGHGLLMLRFCVPQVMPWSIMAGYFGVEIFFVLSGFLIGGILIRDLSEGGASGGTLSRFWCRRWLRTLPLYYLFVVINLAMDASLGLPVKNWGWNLVFLQNFTTPAGRFFIEGWSLAVEEWFYLLAPMLIFVLVKTGSPLKRAVLWTAVGGIVCASAWRMYVVATANPDFLRGVRSVVTMRLDACMFGVLAAWWNHYAPLSWNARRKSKLLAGLLFLVGAGVMFRLMPINTSFAARTHLFTLTSFGAMLCLPALAAMRTVGGKAADGVTCLSKWSYALYLVNLPIFRLLSLWVAAHVHNGSRQLSVATAAALAFVALAVLASVALHYGFERPILRWRDRHVRKARLSVEEQSATEAGERLLPVEQSGELVPAARAV